jgi:dienelactone hydrolase
VALQGDAATVSPFGVLATPWRRPGIAPLSARLQTARATVERLVHRRTVLRAARVLPRTMQFLLGTLPSATAEDAPTAPRVSAGLAAQVAMDELVMSLVLSPRHYPPEREYVRVGQEVATARALYRAAGWLGDPVAYHREPPALEDSEATVRRRWWAGLGYERLDFDSGFSPRPGEPGAERWSSYHANHRASAAVLRHPGAPRPWVVGIHGFGMGWPTADFVGLHARRLHRELGVNVALPVLPLHGPRKVGWVSGLSFLSFDLMNGVHGLTQSVWDVRRVLSWIRGQGAPTIALYGISLGGHVASLLSGIEPNIDAVIAGVPVTDLPALYEAHSPGPVLDHAVAHGVMGVPARDVHSVVSPLLVSPHVAPERRFVFGGYGDRLSRPSQAHRLWQHWGRPAIHWYPGNHAGYLWSPQVTEFLTSSLRTSGICHRHLAASA